MHHVIFDIYSQEIMIRNSSWTKWRSLWTLHATWPKHFGERKSMLSERRQMNTAKGQRRATNRCQIYKSCLNANAFWWLQSGRLLLPETHKHRRQVQPDEICLRIVWLQAEHVFSFDQIYCEPPQSSTSRVFNPSLLRKQLKTLHGDILN